jgi:hypothetical protein
MLACRLTDQFELEISLNQSEQACMAIIITEINK